MEISFLKWWELGCFRLLVAERRNVPFKYLTDVGEVHLDTVFILVGAQLHLREPPSLLQLLDGCKTLVRSEEKPEKKKHTRAIERQATKGSGVFSALGQCTSVKINMMGGTQDEDALARLQNVSQSAPFEGRKDAY